MFIPMTVWGDPRCKSAFHIDLFPILDAFVQNPVRSVLVYAASFDDAVRIARAEARSLALEPREANANRLN